MKRRLGLLAGLLLMAGLARAQPPGDPDLQFAEKLFAERDFYRAIGEYKRYLFRHSGSALADWVEFRIGESYLAGGKPDAAIEAFEDLFVKTNDGQLKRRTALSIARANYQQGRYQRSLGIIDSVLPQLKDPDLAGYARYLSGCIYLKTGRPERSQEAFSAVWAGHRLAPQAMWMAEKVPQAADLPEKSPFLAGVLSLVPGLGHVYLGEYAIAVTAFAWNGLFGFATYDTFRRGNIGVGSLLAALSLLWYSGTVYGAVSGAHRYNRDARLNFYDMLDAGAGLDPVFPDPGFVGGILIEKSLP